MEKEYKEYLIQGQITEVKKSLFNFEGPLKDESQRKDLQKVKNGTLVNGGVAQLGEHLPCTQGVRGSNPLISTTRQGEANQKTKRI